MLQLNSYQFTKMRKLTEKWKMERYAKAKTSEVRVVVRLSVSLSV